ncbi:MAG TPA: glycosyltransferase, partial [Patescibacteria group bacterium]|nr:glycosyltransferase [Patescibacteria group bacterium]
MNIVQVNLFDTQGGAARIAGDITVAATAAGHQVVTFAHRKSSSDSNVIALPFPGRSDFAKLMQHQQRHGYFDLFSAALLPMIDHDAFRKADIVHLHCINGGYFSYYLLPFLATKKLIWTFHDPLAITAQCLYPHRCNHWQKHYCSECPIDKNSGGPKLKRDTVQRIKEDVLRMLDFTVVVPSKWMENIAHEGIY